MGLTHYSLLLMLKLCLSKNVKLSLHKNPLFGLAVRVGEIARLNLYAAMLVGDGIMLSARV